MKQFPGQFIPRDVSAKPPKGIMYNPTLSVPKNQSRNIFNPLQKFSPGVFKPAAAPAALQGAMPLQGAPPLQGPLQQPHPQSLQAQSLGMMPPMPREKLNQIMPPPKNPVTTPKLKTPQQVAYPYPQVKVQQPRLRPRFY